MSVALRKKNISKDRKSLYLDFYPHIIHPDTGKETRREFLGIYIFTKPKNQLEREENKENMKIAESKRSERQLAINKGDYSFLSKKPVRKTGDFTAYFFDKGYNMEEKRTKLSWLTAHGWLKRYKENISFDDITKEFVEGFKQFLLSEKKLSINSAHLYYSKFKAALNSAYKEDKINEKVTDKISPIKKHETIRNHLTIEELRKLDATECASDVLKRAALFSAFTGLRYSDIERLRWSDVYEDSNGHFLHIIMKKTKKPMNIRLSDEAFELLNPQDEQIADKQVFHGIMYDLLFRKNLSEWLKKAGINRNITFHSFRHTYAFIQLELGTDIYTLSKLLGHYKVNTTEIYAHQSDRKIIEASNRISLRR